MEEMNLILHNFAMSAMVPIDGRTYRRAAEAIEEALQERDAEWIKVIDGMVEEAYTVASQTGSEAWHLVCIQLNELKSQMEVE